MKCEEKRKMTQAVAETVIERARTNKKRALRAILFTYQCCKCGFWHLTHQAPRRQLSSAEQYGTRHLHGR